MSMAGRILRHARLRAGLTQRELSRESGVPQETIARIEAGRTDPRLGTLDRLLAAAGWGLEVMPRPGDGIDRTLFSLDQPPEERAKVAALSNESNLRLVTRLRRAE
jgi:transcriptional regulator with XRE-family HTH domain